MREKLKSQQKAGLSSNNIESHKSAAGPWQRNSRHPRGRLLLELTETRRSFSSTREGTLTNSLADGREIEVTSTEDRQAHTLAQR
jgi:hypothetical protein